MSRIPRNVPTPAAAVALPDLVLTLEPDGAGRQQISNPGGGGGSPLPAPTNFGNIGSPGSTSVTIVWSFSGSGHDHFTLHRWRSGVDTSWKVLATLAPTARSYTDSAGLTPELSVGYRIEACTA